MKTEIEWIQVINNYSMGVPSPVNIEAPIGTKLLFLFGDGSTCIVTRILGGFKDNNGNKYSGGTPMHFSIIELPKYEKVVEDNKAIKQFLEKLCDLINETFNKNK